MLAIKFEFTAKRYHATEWGRHVNEGTPEWPPSPWRILRGMVATWRRTLPEIPSERVIPILEALASEYPEFHLPPASTGHTRHFMPYIEGRDEKRHLVIDSFVAVCPGRPLFAVWPNLELDSERRDDLGAILHNMPYLGRAESWVEASLLTEDPGVEINSRPLEDGALPEGDWEIVRTLMPRCPVELEDLERETSTLRRGGRIDPEGAQWWPYIRRRDCFTEFRLGSRQTRGRSAGATVVRFAMDGNPLPMGFDTLRWGELARRSAMARYGRRNEGASSEKLSGKDASGKPLSGEHRHAFYLPADEDGDGRLDHLTVWTPGGLDEKEFRAVVSVNTLKPEGRDPVQLSYLAHGKEDEFGGVSRLFEKSKHWRSMTPYVLPRHTKFRGPKDEKRMVDGPAEQIRREVSLRYPDGPRLQDVKIVHNRERIEPMESGRFSGFRPFEFFRYKRGGGSNGGGAYNFTLEFEKPVRGPIALGFACHYGLGLFVPADS